MISQFIKYLGIFIIIVFSALSIFFSLIHREVTDPYLKSIISYPAHFEDRFYDWRASFSIQKEGQDNDIVLAKIDDYTLKHLGQWPLGRQYWAKFLNKMNTYGAKIVAFDIFFSEPENSCNGIFPDTEFKNSIINFQKSNNQKVIIPYGADVEGTDHYNEVPNELLNFMLKTKMHRDINILKSHISKSVFPLNEINQAKPALGLIKAEKDLDGVFRNYPLVVNFDGLYFPSFPVIIYEAYKGKSAILHFDSTEEKYLITEDGHFDLNFKGETKVRWAGGENFFKSMSVYDILKAKDNDESLKSFFNNKIVFVGSTAYGAHDLRRTPIESELPGVYFHMNMAHMILNSVHFMPRGKSTFLSWCILLSASILMILVMSFQWAVVDFFTAMMITTGLTYLDIKFLTPNGYEIKLFFCIFSVFACYIWATVVEFYQSEKEKNKIKMTFARFVSPEVVNQMLLHPKMATVGGIKKEITVFFSDIRNFTKVSEDLTPEELSEYLNLYMTLVTDVIFKTFGTLDKYIGDAVVAFWGAPLDLKNHAYYAIKAATLIMEELPKLNEQLKAKGFPTLNHGIGINTGICNVGNMGSETIFSYTAIGDSVNLGSRLEQLCKHYGINIHISEFTKKAISSELQKEFKFRLIDHMRVKGKDGPVTTYEVLFKGHPLYDDEENLNRYLKAFSNYENKLFKESIEELDVLLKKFPKDKPSQLLKKNSEFYLKNPPPEDWDKLTHHLKKSY